MEVITDITAHDYANHKIDFYYDVILRCTGLDLHAHRREMSPPGDRYYIIIRFIISVLLAFCHIIKTKGYPENTVINEYTIDGNQATMVAYHGNFVFDLSFGRTTTWTVTIKVTDVIRLTQTVETFEFGYKVEILRFLKKIYKP
jgi:hypothetical protein